MCIRDSPSGGHEMGQPHLGQVLRDPRHRAGDLLGQFAHRELAIQQQGGDAQPGGVGEDPQHLDGEGHHVVVDRCEWQTLSLIPI